MADAVSEVYESMKENIQPKDFTDEDDDSEGADVLHKNTADDGDAAPVNAHSEKS